MSTARPSEIEQRVRRRARGWWSDEEEQAGFVRMEVEAARALGVDTVAALDALLDAGRSEDVQARACALATSTGDRRSSVPRLVRLLTETEFDGVRCEAAQALYMLGGKNVFRLTVPVALGHPNRDVREWATYALAMGVDFDTGAASDVLLTIFTRPAEDPLVRAQAAEGLGNHVPRRRRRRYAPHLIAALGDPSADVRFWASFALSDLGTNAEIPALEAVLGDRTVSEGASWSVGREARFAIECIREYEATRRMSYERHGRYHERHASPEWPESGELA